MRAKSAGGNHQRHVCQKGAAIRGSLILLLLSAPASQSLLSGVFVVSGVWVNELSFNRPFRSLNHLYAITLRIVLNFVHDVVDEEHSAARRSEQISGVAWIRNLTNVEALSLVFDSETRFLRRQFRRDLQQLGRIVFVAVFDSVDKSFVEGHEEVRTLRSNQTELGD